MSGKADSHELQSAALPWFFICLALLFITSIIIGCLGIFLYREYDSSKKRTDMNQIAEAIIAYYEKNGRYPQTIEDLDQSERSSFCEALRRASGSYELESDGTPFLFYCGNDGNYFFSFKLRRWESAD